jgi:hypothetical protein
MQRHISYGGSFYQGRFANLLRVGELPDQLRSNFDNHYVSDHVHFLNH